jgi:hypothetical protein
MNEQTPCSYPGDRTAALISYLYGEESADGAFDQHLSTCGECREELDALRGVRGRLAEWAPPEPARALARPRVTASRRRFRQALAEIPAWAQIAAASLIVGVSVGVANVSVHYGTDGFIVRSGWWPVEVAAPQPPADPDNWRAELAALKAEVESGLTEMRSAAEQTTVNAGDGSQTDETVMREVRSLVAESDRKFQRELALRVADVLRDVNAQRRADLVNIDRSIGTLQNNMGMELLKQREQVNNYMLRVSSQK